MAPDQHSASGKWRRARLVRLARRVVNALRVTRSGVVDLEYCRAQTGRRFRTRFQAALHYVASPHTPGFSPHPLFEPTALDSRLPTGMPAVLGYLTEETLFGSVSPHPLFSLTVAEQHLRSTGVELHGGAWLTWVQMATETTPVPVPAPFDPISWGELRATLIRCAAEWQAGRAELGGESARTSSQQGTARRDSIVVPIAGGADSVLRELALLGEGKDRELVCLVRSRLQYSCLEVVARNRTSIVVRKSVGTVSGDWNVGAKASSGDCLIFVAPRSRLDPAAVDRLSEALADRSVAVAQPLNERADMTIHSAGAYFAPGSLAPSPLLTGHPVSDAERAGQRTIPAVYSSVVAVRADLFFSLGGFDERFGNDLAEVDFSLRATQAGAGRALLVPEARVREPAKRARSSSGSANSIQLLAQSHDATPPGSAEYLASVGFEVAGHRPVAVEGTPAGGLVQVPRLARPRAGLEALPSLRWTIDTPVTAGWWADIWGDWHFAGSLARALRRLGQQVAVDTKAARERESRRFDDVLLVLRGLDQVPPAEGRVNLMWIISHPDDVTADEVAGYDQVFAASATWAAARSAAWGVPIRTLQQCTDAELFHPGRRGTPNGRVLFVGNARRHGNRPIVEAALEAGIEVDLYGTGWDRVPAAKGRLVALRVPNAETGRLYADAGVVLNDHWEDMREHGFISNRLFDAVATGARVLSDPISGAEGLFGGSVQFCESPEDVARLLLLPYQENWPDLPTRLVNAERVRREHSFDQRV